jgi:beta-glucosidase
LLQPRDRCWGVARVARARSAMGGVIFGLLLLFSSAGCFFGRSSNSDRSTFNPVPSVDCTSEPQASYPFCNPKLDAGTRASDLVSRLSLLELIEQTSTIAPGISRLGINAYNWRSNCLHGWDKGGGPDWLGYTWTVFPAPIGLAASFDKELVLKVGQVTSTESRALHNIIMAHYNGSSQEASGVNCFAPNVNLLRDPRWGRALETFGEDPYLISLLGLAYTRGLQEGSDSKHVKVAACAKHFAVHSGPDQLRKVFVAEPTVHDLYDTYLPAFKSQVIAGKVMQIMPAYSSLKCKYAPEGAPDAANDFLLKSVLRGQFGAQNISVCSDNGAVAEVYTTHDFTRNLLQAAAVCMNAGTDLDLGHDEIYPLYLPLAYVEDIVQLDTIRQAVWRSFYLRIRVGDFDPVSLVPYQSINSSQLNTPESQALNLKSAHESIVLLKNSGHLPLNIAEVKKIAVIGPNANSSAVLISDYEGIPAFVTTVYDGIKNTGIAAEYAPGCSDVACTNQKGFDDVLKILLDADYVVAVMGLDGSVEGEGHDRANTTCDSEPIDNIALPGCQTALIEAVTSINPRVILVLLNGGPVSIPNLYENSGVLAVIEAFYPGPLGGTAVADVIFGKYNPGGKLPFTIFNSTNDVPVATDYNMTTPPGRTYRYYTGRPLFPFGYGLSYTSFKYSQLALSANSIEVCSSVNVKVSVQNVGDVQGDEVIQIYVEPPRISGKPFIPNTQLVGFERVGLAPSASHTGNYEVNAYSLSLVDEDGEHYVFPGQYTVVATGGVGDRLTASFSVTGTVTNVEDCKGVPLCFGC